MVKEKKEVGGSPLGLRRDYGDTKSGQNVEIQKLTEKTQGDAEAMGKKANHSEATMVKMIPPQDYDDEPVMEETVGEDDEREEEPEEGKKDEIDEEKEDKDDEDTDDEGPVDKVFTEREKLPVIPDQNVVAPTSPVPLKQRSMLTDSPEGMEDYDEPLRILVIDLDDQGQPTDAGPIDQRMLGGHGPHGPGLRCPACGGMHPFREAALKEKRTLSCPDCKIAIPTSAVYKAASNEYRAVVAHCMDPHFESLRGELKGKKQALKRLDAIAKKYHELEKELMKKEAAQVGEPLTQLHNSLQQAWNDAHRIADPKMKPVYDLIGNAAKVVIEMMNTQQAQPTSTAAEPKI